MRVLVVGTVPPPGGNDARRLAKVAASHLAAGEQVSVLSPDPRSAAHRNVRLEGLRLIFWLVLASRRHDALELRIQSGLPLAPEAGRLWRGVVLVALGYSLGLYKQVTLRLDSPIPLAGGVGGRATHRLWRAVQVVVVDNETDREMLLTVPGLEDEQVLVDSGTTSPQRPPTSNWPQATDRDLRRSVLAEIRRQTADERALRAARRELKAPEDELTSVFELGGRVRPSLQGFARAVVRAARRRVLALGRAQRDPAALVARSR